MHECKFEDKIIEIAENSAASRSTVEALDKRINGSIDSFQNHITHGHKWRSSIVGIFIVVVIEIIGFAFLFGLLTKDVERNKDRIKEIANLYE